MVWYNFSNTFISLLFLSVSCLTVLFHPLLQVGIKSINNIFRLLFVHQDIFRHTTLQHQSHLQYQYHKYKQYVIQYSNAKMYH